MKHTLSKHKVGERNHERSFYSHISSKMRELAKMLLEIRKNPEHSMVTLDDCIKNQLCVCIKPTV